MRRPERNASLEAFRTGAARVLVATDAAGEGLNLQHGCRLVVNLDLPWNPVRLEQRIGRVDRIGQPRRVHAVTLTSRGSDSVFLRRLAIRQERIDETLDARTQHPTAAADEAAGAIAAAAALLRLSARIPGARTRRGVPWVLLTPLVRRRLGLPSGVLVVVRLDPRDGCSDPVMVAVMVELPPAAMVDTPPRVLVDACKAIADMAASAYASAASSSDAAGRDGRRTVLRARLHAALAAEQRNPPPAQPGLFDRRAMTATLQRRALEQRRRDALEARLLTLDGHDSGLNDRAPVPIAALVLR